MVSVTDDVSLWYRPCYKNMLSYDNENKCQRLRLSLTEEQILAFASKTNLAKEVKNYLQLSNELYNDCLRYR